ncbi:ATP-dependent Clp protease adaptor ClpS [Psychrobacter sp. 16-MNA-CIBAN-0192]|uniref:ATP-dependent Clp protease adaptor ClpS n=1 Tax=Psychrobacter sp. 16-MNA-CIBAN-0192 TaxID=3140448 RepID=UPI0033223281
MIKNTVTDTHLMIDDWHFPALPVGHRAQVDNPESETTPHTDVLVAEPEIAKPPMYAVVMYNDNYTPMEFVVYILQSEFRHEVEKAIEIMMTIHNSNKGIAGIYPKDIAETKAKKVNSLAHREGYPLLTQIEPHQGE